MPTYEYECNKCGHHFERFQSMQDAPLKRCPECKGAVRRVISGGAGILFKGSGFYTTDYRSESYRKSEGAEKSSASSAPASSTKDASSKKADTSGASK